MPIFPNLSSGSQVAVPVITLTPTDYIVVTAANAAALATAVKAKLAQGWVPIGSATATSTTLYVQGMVTYA